MALQRQLWHIFWICSGVVATILLLHIWNLRLLYSDPIIRERTKTTIQTVAEREGWLISDISLRTVGQAELMIFHHEHVRGPDPVVCYTVAFETLELLPCAL